MRLARTNLNGFTAGVSQKDQYASGFQLKKRLNATSEGEAVLPQLAEVSVLMLLAAIRLRALSLSIVGAGWAAGYVIRGF